jgi:hypothetical protein
MCNESSEVNKSFCTHSYVRCANSNPSCFALALLYFLTIDRTTTLSTSSYVVRGLSLCSVTTTWRRVGDRRCRGQVANTSASYSGGRGFKPRAGDRLYWLRFFVIFHRLSRHILGLHLEIRPLPLPSTSFQIYISLITPSLDIIFWVTEKASLNKLQNRHKAALVRDVGIRYRWVVSFTFLEIFPRGNSFR